MYLTRIYEIKISFCSVPADFLERPLSSEMVIFYITQDTQRHPLLPELRSGIFIIIVAFFFIIIFLLFFMFYAFILFSCDFILFHFHVGIFAYPIEELLFQFLVFLRILLLMGGTSL